MLVNGIKIYMKSEKISAAMAAMAAMCQAGVKIRTLDQSPEKSSAERKSR